MKIVNLTACYGDKKIFDNLSVEFFDGQITCILGASGAGKTTLLRCIANLKEYTGEIDKNSISYVFQEPRLIGRLTVKENLKLVGISDEEILVGLKKIKMLDKINSYPSELSGGEKQRVNFLRAVYFPSEVIVMDEPFSSLDIKTKIELINDFISLWQENKKTVIFVTHDIEETLMLAKRAIVLKGGKVSFEIEIEKDYPREYYDNEKERKLLFSALV